MRIMVCFLLVIFLSSSIRSSSNISGRTLDMFLWSSALVKMISFPRVALDIHFAALLERALLWDAHVAAAVEAAQALLWTVWAGKARWW